MNAEILENPAFNWVQTSDSDTQNGCQVGLHLTIPVPRNTRTTTIACQKRRRRSETRTGNSIRRCLRRVRSRRFQRQLRLPCKSGRNVKVLGILSENNLGYPTRSTPTSQGDSGTVDNLENTRKTHIDNKENLRLLHNWLLRHVQGATDRLKAMLGAVGYKVW